jgi:hypothetical protein
LGNLDGRDYLGEHGVDGILILKGNLNGKIIEEPGRVLSGPGLEKLAGLWEQVKTIPILYKLATENADTFFILFLQDIKHDYDVNKTTRLFSPVNVN